MTSTTMMSYELPQYSSSVPAPDYTFEPASGERVLEYTPRSTRPAPESTFIKQAGKITVVLHNQEENATTPSYGRGATVAGSVLLDSSDNICEVVLKVHGKLETTSSEGARTTTLVDKRQVLWSGNQANGECPSQVSFSVRLPSTFRDNDEERALPPSYNADFHGMPWMFVRSSYSLQFLIRRMRLRKVGFFTKTKRIFIPFEYAPRTRPHRPIVASPCFFSAVKTSPEEWHQAIAPINTPSSEKLGQIFSHLFIPSSRVYGIRDVIPFHVQLNGPQQSLLAFLQPQTKEPVKSRRLKSIDGKTFSNGSPSSQKARSLQPTNSVSDILGSFTSNTAAPIPPASESLSTLAPPSPTSPHQPTLTPFSFSFSSPPSSLSQAPSEADDANRPTLRVFLLRQITIESRPKRKSWRNQILGEAKLIPVPPLLSTSCYSSYGIAEPEEEDHLDWEGELKLNENVTVGGWQAGNVHVKDFIALSVAPQNERTSPLHGIQLTVPVRLVTDQWIEDGLGPGRLPVEAH